MAGATMTSDWSTQRINATRRTLLAWYRRARRDLPWRRTQDPYAIWLSEIMLQQTRVETVIPYYERFLAAFPTVTALAGAPLGDVLKLWEGLGYYTRARNLHKAARQVTNDCGGAWPRTADELRKLAGVGRYTAGAIASIAFGERAAALDGNIQRVLARLFAIDDSIDERATQVELWRLAEQLLSPRAPGDFNQALMELGATVCTPRGPQCLVCPLHEHCEAARSGRAEALPVRSKKAAVPIVHAVAAAIRQRGRWMLVKRPERGLLGGLWELPGGEISSADDAATKLPEIVRAVTGIEVAVGEKLGEVRHIFTHRDLRLAVYVATKLPGRVKLARHDASSWATIEEIAALPLARVDQKVIALLPRDAEPSPRKR